MKSRPTHRTCLLFYDVDELASFNLSSFFSSHGGRRQSFPIYLWILDDLKSFQKFKKFTFCKLPLLLHCCVYVLCSILSTFFLNAFTLYVHQVLGLCVVWVSEKSARAKKCTSEIIIKLQPRGSYERSNYVINNHNVSTFFIFQFFGF